MPWLLFRILLTGRAYINMMTFYIIQGLLMFLVEMLWNKIYMALDATIIIFNLTIQMLSCYMPLNANRLSMPLVEIEITLTRLSMRPLPWGHTKLRTTYRRPIWQHRPSGQYFTLNNVNVIYSSGDIMPHVNNASAFQFKRRRIFDDKISMTNTNIGDLVG